MPFNAPHDQAFENMGAIAPGRHWSAFDVSMERARMGEARRLVTSIWNYHSVINQSGVRTSTMLAICRDTHSRDYWYRVSRPAIGTKRTTWVAHWNRIRLAIETGIPIIGVLKDVKTGKCSLENQFYCISVRAQSDGSALWLQLKPRAEVGCPVRPIDIEQLASEPEGPIHKEFEKVEKVEKELKEALDLTPDERRARLKDAPKLPKSTTVTSTVWIRNYDVVAETLHRAEGICESCKKPAPFIRQSDRTPYLEVHHKVPLSIGGEDTVENAIALCPNCHRQAHFG
jgi:HNH endonuclease